MNILFIVIGSFIMFLGFVVWKFKILEIVVGINEDNIINRKAYAKWIGIQYILMGLTINLNSLISMFVPKITDIMTIVIFTFILYLFAIIIIYGGKKYKKH